jgi:prepilin-type N-terminal cleavage/methylation domain-containing protein
MIFFQHHGKGEDGFTILELILGIVLLSIMSVFFSAAITNSVDSFRLSSASAKVIHDIRFAQQQAMSRNGWYGVEFFASPQNSYHVYLTDGTNNVDVADPAKRGSALSVNLGSGYSVSLSAVDIAGGGKVEFSPLGRPYNNKNGVALATDGSLSLVSGSKTKVIQILRETGRVDTPWN